MSPALGSSLLLAADPERTIFMRSHIPNSLLAMIVGTNKTIYHQRFDQVDSRLEKIERLILENHEQRLKRLEDAFAMPLKK